MTKPDDVPVFGYDKREALAILVAALSKRDGGLFLERKREAANRFRKAIWEVAKDAEVSCEMKDAKMAVSMGGLPEGETFYVKADGMGVFTSTVDRYGHDIGKSIDAPVEYDAGVDAWVSSDLTLHHAVPGARPARRSAVAEVIKLYLLAIEAAEARRDRALGAMR